MYHARKWRLHEAVGMFVMFQQKIHKSLVFVIINMDKSSFRMVFGDSPVIKVLDFLLGNREFDYSLTDIAKGADVGWSTLHQFFGELVRLGIVRKTRKIDGQIIFTSL